MQMQCKEELAMNVLTGKQLCGKAGVPLWKNDLAIFLKEFYSPFHEIRDTEPRTEAQGYRTYTHSACQFGFLGPGSPVPGSTEYSVPKELEMGCTPDCFSGQDTGSDRRTD